VVALLSAACGVRSVEPAPGTTPVGPPPDPLELAIERCRGFPQPDEPFMLLPERHTLAFGACGHLALSTARRVYAPDFRSVVAETSVGRIRFSPDGTRLLFFELEDSRVVVKHVDLLSGRTSEMPTNAPDTSSESDLEAGFSVAHDGSIESWVCERGEFALYRDAPQASNEVFDAKLASCRFNDGTPPQFLVHYDAGLLTLLDLAWRRKQARQAPHHLDRVPDGVNVAIDGFAFQPYILEESVCGDVVCDIQNTGHLYDARTGDLLAEGWRDVGWSLYRNAVNRTLPDKALIHRNEQGIVVRPGLHAAYVFRDNRRAIVLREADGGATDIAFLDFETGETVPLVRTEIDIPELYVRARASPRERAVALEIPGCNNVNLCPDASSLVVRWFEGSVEQIVGPPGKSLNVAFVGDDGSTIAFSAEGSLLLRPGSEPVHLPFIHSNMLWDGRTIFAVIAGPAVTPPTIFGSVIVTFDPSTGRQREWGAVAGMDAEGVTDLRRERIAWSHYDRDETNGFRADAATWVGSYPLPP
jgi:hypothetical protein